MAQTAGSIAPAKKGGALQDCASRSLVDTRSQAKRAEILSNLQ